MFVQREMIVQEKAEAGTDHEGVAKEKIEDNADHEGAAKEKIEDNARIGLQVLLTPKQRPSPGLLLRYAPKLLLHNPPPHTKTWLGNKKYQYCFVRGWGSIFEEVNRYLLSSDLMHNL